MHTGDSSASGSVESFGGGKEGQTPSPTPSDGSAGDNRVPTGWLTACRVPCFARYFVITVGYMRTIEESLICETWPFMYSTAMKVLRAYQVRRVFIL